jgi:hypothetical protein
MPAAVNQIIQSKVPAFITLFDKLERVHGGVGAACRAAGISHNSYSRMKRTHFLTSEVARKILAANSRLKALS